MIIRQFPEKESLVFGSGFESQAYYLSRALGKLGVEVHVLTERNNEPESVRMNGVFVHRFPRFFTRAGVIGCLGYNFSEYGWIRKLLQEYDMDILHSHAAATGVAFLRSRETLNQPLVATFHGTAVAEANAIELSRDFTLKNLINKYVNYRLQGIVDKYTGKKADEITTVSRATATEICHAFRIPLEEIEVVPNGIDLKRFDRKKAHLREELKLGNNPVVLYVGRLVDRKGIRYLLQAIPGILRNVKDAKFLIVGQGPLEGLIRKYAAERGITSALTLLKNVPDKSMHEIYASCDVLVLPSLYEAFPMVILEALASEKAVIATRVGGVPEIIEDGQTGVLVKPADAQALEDSIVSLVQNQTLRRQLARNGRKLVESAYEWGKIAKSHLMLYKRALEH